MISTVQVEKFSGRLLYNRGNPAKLLKTIDKDKLVRPQTADVEFYGYIRTDKFPAYKAKHLGHLNSTMTCQK